jgi:hypothetical protein
MILGSQHVKMWKESSRDLFELYLCSITQFILVVGVPCPILVAIYCTAHIQVTLVSCFKCKPILTLFLTRWTEHTLSLEFRSNRTSLESLFLCPSPDSSFLINIIDTVQIRRRSRKYPKSWNIFIIWLAVLLRCGHTVAQGQTVTCYECGSVVVRLCRVSVA